MPKLKPNQFTLASGAVITEHPVLFQTEMVKANLEDRKTQTRRTKGLSLNVTGKPEKDWTYTECFPGSDTKGNDAWMAMVKHIPTGGTHSDNSPYGKPGDLLWVKETWSKNGDGSIDFKPDFPFTHPQGGWKPSIHMPKTASRIWAMVEDIRVERLQDISERDAEAEGVFEFEDGTFRNYFTKKGLRAEDGVKCLLAKGSFQSLWSSINGLESWDSNPWIWVIKYRILSKTGRPSLDVIEQNYIEVIGKEVEHA